MTGPMGGRSTPPDRCDHSGSATVEQTQVGYAVRCVICQMVGPVRTTPESARKALLVLGARNEEPREQRPLQARADDRSGEGTA